MHGDYDGIKKIRVGTIIFLTKKFAQITPIDVLHKNSSQEKGRKILIQRWATQLEVPRTHSYRRLRAVLTRIAFIVDEERGEPLTPRDACRCPPIITIGGGGGKWLLVESNGVELK